MNRLKSRTERRDQRRDRCSAGDEQVVRKSRKKLDSGRGVEATGAQKKKGMAPLSNVSNRNKLEKQ